MFHGNFHSFRDSPVRCPVALVWLMSIYRNLRTTHTHTHTRSLSLSRTLAHTWKEELAVEPQLGSRIWPVNFNDRALVIGSCVQNPRFPATSGIAFFARLHRREVVTMQLFT